MTRTMKDSGVPWIGEIPSLWELYRIKKCVLDRTSGSWGKEAAKDKGDIICLRIADFDYDKFRFKDTSIDELTVRNYDEETIDKLMLKKGDILIEKSGGGEKTPVGRTVIYDKDYPALYANFMDRLRCSELVISQWLQYVFVTFYKNGYSKNYIKQTTGIQNLDLTSMLSNEYIPVPSINEQHRIAAFLDTECARIDDVIEKTRTTIEEYQKLKQAVITRAVTKGIRPNRPMKDSGIEMISKIPVEWITPKTLYCLEMPITDGPHTTPELFDDGIPFVSAEAVSTGNGHINFEHIRGYISQEFYEECCKKYTPQIDDVYMIKSGATTGRVSIVDDDRIFTIWSPIAVFRAKKERIFPLFLFFCLQADYVQKQIEIGWTYGTQQNIGMRTLEQIKLCIPPVKEQKDIADYLDKKCAEIDALIAQKEQLIVEMESYKKSLIYEYVTGKKEVV